jgi:hypothetical protein
MFANSFPSSARSSSRSKFALRTRSLRLASLKSCGIHRLMNFRIPRSLTRTRLIPWCVDESHTARTRAERNSSSLNELIITPENSIRCLPGLTRLSIEKSPALNFRHQYLQTSTETACPLGIRLSSVSIALYFLPSIKRTFITYLCSVRSILILYTSDNVRLSENDFTLRIGDRLIICK